MVVSKILTGAPVGYDGYGVEVEGDATRGLPGIQIVGLANKSIDEAKERIKSAIVNSFLDYPSNRITINLAPAEIPKEGTHFDLPIALAVLVRSGQLRQNEVDGALFAGELALDGSIRPIKGVISLAETARSKGLTTLYIPKQDVAQAQLVSGIDVVGVDSLKQLYLHLKKESLIQAVTEEDKVKNIEPMRDKRPKLDDIHGQEQAKRALIIAAAGRHNLLLNGSPGAGKTMLAKTLTTILPELSDIEQIAVTKIHSLSDESTTGVATSRPFRSPHHTASRVALIGGGNRPKPGEISLAHHGVLFLDEIPEYPRSTLESLRQPLEDRSVSISRANGHVSYPADFMLIATMNPCPCGYLGDSKKECTCTTNQILGYQKKLSGPLMDRIDMTVTVSRVPNDDLLAERSLSSDQHSTARNMVGHAIERQRNRYGRSDVYNASISSTEIKTLIPLSTPVRSLLSAATEKLHLSARGYFKIIKIARTIADLAGSDDVKTEHISEALQYRETS